MTKKYKLILIVTICFYPVYKCIREFVWVKHGSYTLENCIFIKVRIDPEIVGFLDFNDEKTITIINNVTKAKMKISFVSIEPDLFFYVDTLNSIKTLSVVDKFAGKNTYNFLTLKLTSSTNCFEQPGGCGGFDESSFYKLGKPNLVYDNLGLHE